MKPVRFVYFDLGNVLLHFDHETIIQNLVRLTRGCADRLRAALFASGLEDRYESGLLSSEELVAELSAALGYALPMKETLEALSDMFEPNHAMLEVLEYVRSARVPMGLLSNTCDAHWNWVRRNRYQTVEGWFDHHVLSFRVQSMKPAKLIYEYAGKIAAVPTDAIFFVDDKIDNVLAARAVGWQAELFKSAAELQEQLRARLHLAEGS